MIRWYINQLHVATSDEEIARDIGQRAIDAGWHPLAAVGAIGHALELHHANQEQYRWIMSGFDGSPTRTRTTCWLRSPPSSPEHPPAPYT
jgi:hypothetical protein